MHIGTGIPADEAKKLKGTHWTMRLNFVGGNKILTVVECLEMPEMNMIDTFEEGVIKEVDHPMLGGKGKVRNSKRW